MRLHHNGKTEMTGDDGQDVLRPELTEVGMWKRQRIRSNHSSGANACFSGGFERGSLTAVGMGPHIWQVQRNEHVLQPSVLSWATVDQWPYDVGAEGLERSDGACVDVQDQDGVSEVLKDLGDAMPGAQRDVAFVAQTAGEDSDTEWETGFIVNLRSGRVRARGRLRTDGDYGWDRIDPAVRDRG